MISKEKRSPEVVEEYFALLKWRRNGSKVVLSDEILMADEKLRLIEESINENKLSIDSHRMKIKSLESEILAISEQVERLSNQLLSIKQEILNIQTKNLEIQDTLYKLGLPVRDDDILLAVPPLKAGKRFTLLLFEVDKDLGILFLGLIKLCRALITINERTIIAYAILLFLLMIYFLIRLTELKSEFIVLVVSYLLYFSYILYLYIKLEHIDRNYERLLRQQMKQDLRVRRQQQDEIQKLKLQQISQDLEEKRKVKEREYYLCEVNRNKLLSSKQNFEYLVDSHNHEVANLVESNNRNEQEYQWQIEALEEQERNAKTTRLEELEGLTTFWLESDISRLTKKAKKKLRIKDLDSIGERHTLKYKPIPLLIGLTENIDRSFVVNSKYKASGSLSEEIRANPEDFISEMNLYGQFKKHGIYEFFVIFVSSNFFSYYRCYWNFIRGRTINDEICEYLYDTIVSVEIHEKSSVRFSDKSRRNIIEKSFSIVCSDGKERCFSFSRNKLSGICTLRYSEIDDVVAVIRNLLRQRQIDVTLVKDVDS